MKAPTHTSAMLLAILAVAACGRSADGVRASADAATPEVAAAVEALPHVRIAELRELATKLDALAAVDAGAEEIARALPPWIFSPHGAIVEPADERSRAELRAILGARKIPPRVRALAMLRLAAAFDLGDLSAIAPLTAETADVGRFPLQVVENQALRTANQVRWGQSTLGDTARAALHALTGTALANEADVERWIRENPEPLSSFAYWEKTLEAQHETARKARLGALRDANPVLFMRVLLAEKQRSHFAWWAQEDLARVVRERVGATRLVRLLGGHESFPELAEPDRFDAFASWILGHADALFTTSDAAGLLAVWESEGARYPSSESASKLALAAARFNPAERPRIAETSLGYLRQHRDRVVADLVEHGLPVEMARVERWFRGEGVAKEARSEVQRGVLMGLGALGQPGKPYLAALLRDPQFKPESDEIIVASVAAATSLGAKDVCPDASALEPPHHHKLSREQAAAEEANRTDRARRADRARRECIPRIQRWLAGG